MNTELIFAVTVTVAVIVAVILTLKHAPSRRPLFMFHFLNAALGPERPPAWRPPAFTLRKDHKGKLAPAESRVADRGESLQTA